MTGFIQSTLPELFREITVLESKPKLLPAVVVTGIVYDSRQVQPGNLFVALRGGNTDGHRFIPMAIERGAVAVVGMDPLESALAIPYIRVENSRIALARLSAGFYNFPARHLTVIGVTGTDGKTTTSNLIYQIMLAANIRGGMISTVSAMVGDEELDTGFHVTTPEAPEIQRYLARMLAAGLSHVVLESTSHGLAQHRVEACEFDIAVVTNITHEHLDYHGTYEAYQEAKGLLFTSLIETKLKERGNPRLAVLNFDDMSYEYLQSISHLNQVAYSLEPGVDLWAEEVGYDSSGLHFIARSKDFHQPITSSLVGGFNVSNCLAALGATIYGLGINPAIAAKGISALNAVPGRMERIDLGQKFLAIVDFAHTPNALRQALQTARQMTSGKVIAVFGSAGLRDRAKRRLMAEVSIELADNTILTAEDPRTESLCDILAEMADAARKRGGEEDKTFWRIPDRGSAIRFGLGLANSGDVVISCGKGHEQSMCFETTEYPWDDRVAMRAALCDYLRLDGPAMPYLPTRDQ